MYNLFKTLLIIILLAFLYLYYENSNNDRYFLRSQSKITGVFDKKTGTLYLRGRGVQSENWIRHTTMKRY